FQSGVAILPGAICMVLVAPRSAKLVDKQGSRLTMLTGYVFVLLGFLTMLLLWQDNTPYWMVALGYAFVGIGVGFAGTPASHSLTGSVPVTRVGMASGTADLQRDLGGAIMQSIFGALLAAGFTASANAAIQASGMSADITSTIQTELVKSFGGAETIASQYPQYASVITAEARASFLAGDQWAYLAGITAVLLGGVLVFFFFPKHAEETAQLARFEAEDAASLPSAAPVAETQPGGAVPVSSNQ
ncbi:MAG TPA: MFS transporter, partial [Chloroflexota bacterium]